MRRITTLFCATAIGAITLVGCGSDGGTASNDADTTVAGVDTTVPSGSNDTSGGGGGNPLSNDECRAIYQQIIGAMAAVMAPGSDVDVSKVFGDASANVPDDLKDDVQILATAVTEIAKAMKDNPNDPGAMQAAVKEMSTPEVQAASEAVNAYFDETCPS